MLYLIKFWLRHNLWVVKIHWENLWEIAMWLHCIFPLRKKKNTTNGAERRLLGPTPFVLATFSIHFCDGWPLTEAEQEKAQEIRLTFAFHWQDWLQVCWGGNFKLLTLFLSYNKHSEGWPWSAALVHLKLFWASLLNLNSLSVYSISLPPHTYYLCSSCSSKWPLERCILTSYIQRTEWDTGLRNRLNVSQSIFLR